jgi:hypothetical protein
MARYKKQIAEGHQRTFRHSLLSNRSVIPEKKNFEFVSPIRFYVKLCYIYAGISVHFVCI